MNHYCNRLNGYTSKLQDISEQSSPIQSVASEGMCKVLRILLEPSFEGPTKAMEAEVNCEASIDTAVVDLVEHGDERCIAGAAVCMLSLYRWCRTKYNALYTGRFASHRHT
jgi:hypothetical protein